MAACSHNDDDEPTIPSDAIALNMVVGDSESTIGGSDVYISSALNFTSDYCAIADLGKKGGFGKNPVLKQIAQEMAVAPGCYYQITLAQEIQTIAGVRAYPICSNYYNVYVDSWIYDKDNQIAGARIRYAEAYPAVKQLPAWGSSVAMKVKRDGNICRATYSFADGCEIDDAVDVYYSDGYENKTDKLSLEIKGNKLSLTYPFYSSDLAPYVKLLVRYENSYTRVYLTLE